MFLCDFLNHLLQALHFQTPFVTMLGWDAFACSQTRQQKRAG